MSLLIWSKIKMNKKKNNEIKVSVSPNSVTVSTVFEKYEKSLIWIDKRYLLFVEKLDFSTYFHTLCRRVSEARLHFEV